MPLVRRFGPAAVALIYAAFSALWIVLSGSVLELSVSDPVLQSRLELAKGFAFVVVSSFVLYALMRVRREHPDRLATDDVAPASAPSRLLLTCVLVVLAVPVVGLGVFALNARQVERETFDNLQVVARSMAQHIEGWVAERHGDAATLGASRGFVEQVTAVRADPVSSERAELSERLRTLREVFGYTAVTIVDPSGGPLVGSGLPFAGDPAALELVRDAVTLGEVRMGEMYRDASGLNLSFAVPLHGRDGEGVVGVVVLRSDPAQFLLPLVRAWPLPGESGEMVLVRADRDTVLFLNDLRHGNAGALSLRVPLDDPNRVAAVALASEGPGEFMGLDYRDERVLAAWSVVEGTDWRAIAKIDRDEALRPAWATAWWTAAVALLGVIFVMAAVVMLFRQQRAAQQLQLEVQADRLLKYFYDLPFVGMAISEADTQRMLRYNDRLCEMFGYDAQSFARQTWSTLGHPDDAGLGAEDMARMERGEIDGFRCEKRFVRQDGSSFIGRLDVRCVRKADGSPDHIVTTVEDVTEAFRTEQALRESEQRFRLLLQGVPSVAVQGYALDGTARYWNKASETLYGYTAEEAIGRNMLDLIVPPETRGQVLAAMRHMLETGELYPPAELTLMRKDGTRVTVFSSPARVVTASGEPELFCVDVDLTARKQAEEALRASEAEFRTLAEATPQIVWVTLPDGEHVYFNQHWLDFTGLTLEQSQGFGWNAPFHPDDRERAARAWQRAIATGEPYEMEYRLRRHDGVYHWMLGRAVPMRDDQGGIVKWFGTCTDIDDLKRTVERLDHAQRIGRIGDWECDLATETIYWSPQVYGIFGRDPALGPPRDFAEHHALYDEKSRAVLHEYVQRAVDTGETQEYELVFVRPDGERVYVQAVAVPRKDEQTGRVVGLVGTVQDVTARKRDEQALRARAHQQVLVARLGRLALSDADLDAVFDAAAEAVAEGLGVEFGRVMLVGADGTFFVRSGVGWEPKWLGWRVPDGAVATHVGDVVAAGGPLIVHDFRQYGHFLPEGMLASHGVVSGIAAPIGRNDKPVGVLGAYSRNSQSFSPDDSGFVQSIANTLNAAIERARASERLTYMVQHDVLTGLPNRLLLTDRLHMAMARADRSGRRMALMFIDLDRFKNVNDVFGHDAGDAVLQEVARRLRAAVRASDTVSRQGGDEFLVILPEIQCDEDAARVAQKLIGAVLEPFRVADTEVVLGASIGIVCYPDNGGEVETLLRNADVAMYAAKDLGRGRYQFYSEEMNTRTHERLRLESDLRQALERGELSLAYQPQVDLATGRVVGLEALMRWRHPERGIVSPGQFIPIAEDCGLITAFGTWALETACRQHAEWVAEGLLDGTIAVNVSALQFRQHDFVETVSGILARTGLAPRLLEVEVTESVVMRGVEEVRDKLTSLDRLGVKLAIDDFGTGYSSLSYLKQFPIYRLKVDQSFTRGLPEDRESLAIVQAIIGLARSLGLDVLAEGIETPEQAASLRSLLCDAGQGYLYARPMDAAACADWMRQQAADRKPR